MRHSTLASKPPQARTTLCARIECRPPPCARYAGDASCPRRSAKPPWFHRACVAPLRSAAPNRASERLRRRHGLPAPNRPRTDPAIGQLELPFVERQKPQALFGAARTCLAAVLDQHVGHVGMAAILGHSGQVVVILLARIGAEIERRRSDALNPPTSARYPQRHDRRRAWRRWRTAYCRRARLPARARAPAPTRPLARVSAAARPASPAPTTNTSGRDHSPPAPFRNRPRTQTRNPMSHHSRCARVTDCLRAFLLCYVTRGLRDPRPLRVCIG